MIVEGLYNVIAVCVSVKPLNSQAASRLKADVEMTNITLNTSSRDKTCSVCCFDIDFSKQNSSQTDCDVLFYAMITISKSKL